MSQLSLLESKLSFNNVKFSVIDQNNQVWLKSTEIGQALGYKQKDAIVKIYNRNKDEFTEKMTQVIEIVDTVNLGVLKKSPLGQIDRVKNTKEFKHKIRIFSLRGCHLLAMLADTPKAKEFRKWVLDILENQIPNQTTKPKQKALPPAKQKFPPLMFDYEPSDWKKDWVEFHARQMLERYDYKTYAYNAYMLSCKANDLFNDFEKRIKEIMKDYDKLSKPVYKEMMSKVIGKPYNSLDNCNPETKEERNERGYCLNFTSTMWQTIDNTYAKLMYSRSDDLRNEVDHMIQTLRHTAKILDM